MISVSGGRLRARGPANFDPRQGGEVERGRPGTTRQDQGAIARFIASRGRGLHHVAVKAHAIDRVLQSMAQAGLPMIDTASQGRSAACSCTSCSAPD